MSANTVPTATQSESTAMPESKHSPTTYNILTGAYARLMAVKKDDWDTYMLTQKQTLLDEYEHYREIAKLLKQIARKPKVREFYRFIAPQPMIDQVAKLHREYTLAVKRHFNDPAKHPMPAPFALPKPEEGHWELVIETDSRNQDQALELLRMRWMDNPLATAQKIVEVLADWPAYRSDDKTFRTEHIKRILRQAQRLLLNPQPTAGSWHDPMTPEMRKIAMVSPAEVSNYASSQFMSIPANLTLLETEFDIYQRHMTCVYVTNGDGRPQQLDLPLDNEFARLRSTNRKSYKAEKFNPRYEAQLTDGSDSHNPVQRSLRFLARQVAEGNQVKIVTDKTAAHGYMVVRAIAALVPEEEAKVKAANPKAGGSGTHHMDDRDYVDEYDRPARHIWTVPNLEFCYWKLRNRTLGSAHGPIPVPDLRATKKDAADIKWWNLYWMPRRNLAYLVYSVRRFYDQNGIKKHVVICQPPRIYDGDKIVRKHRAHWMVVEDSELRQLCHSRQKLAQYDWDGNVTGYSNYRRAPASFRGELPEKFTTLLTPAEIRTLKPEQLKPAYEWGRKIGYTLKPQPWDYDSQMRNTFAWILATVRGRKSFQRVMATISRWEYEKEHGFEHKTLKNATLELTGASKKTYHEDEHELSNGRFDRNDDILNPTYEEFAEATMYAEGARDGLDLLADGEISLATAAELAAEASKPTRKPVELAVEAALDKQLKELREKDQKRADLRRAEELIEILAMLKRHPELEAHMSRQLNPEGRICKIWNIMDRKADGYVHTPISQMYHLRPITVRKNGVNLTPEEQTALPENEGRRYIAAEWTAQPGKEDLFMAAPNPWKELEVRHGKRIYRTKRNYSLGGVRFLHLHTTKTSGIMRKAAAD